MIEHPDYPDWLNHLGGWLGGGALVAVISWARSRRRDSAEANKLEAEAEKIEAEVENLGLSAKAKWDEAINAKIETLLAGYENRAKDLMAEIETIRAAYETRVKDLVAEIETTRAAYETRVKNQVAEIEALRDEVMSLRARLYRRDVLDGSANSVP